MDNWKDHSEIDENLLSATEESLEWSKNWFVLSGLQNLEDGAEFFGALHSWYDFDTDSFGFFYPEATGYAISFFLYLNALEKNKEFIDRAVFAAEWLKKYALDPNQPEIRYKFVSPPDPSSSDFSYSFDNSIISSGFVNLFRGIGDSQYLDLAKGIADRMIQNMQSEEGYFFSHYDLKEGRILKTEDKWSTQPNVHHAKNAIFLLRLYEVTRIERYRESAIKVCRWALSKQLTDGRFVTNFADNSTLLHPHCYALEGILYTGFYLNDEKMIKSGIQGIRWLLRSQLPNGGIPAEFTNNSFGSSERGDSLAQTIRLTVLALNNGWIERQDFSSLLKMVKRLREFQNLEGPSSQKGGFRFLIEGDGTPVNHLNSWVTMFAVQALEMFLEFCDRRLENEFEYIL
jgi:hypothetical protein